MPWGRGGGSHNQNVWKPAAKAILPLQWKSTQVRPGPYYAGHAHQFLSAMMLMILISLGHFYICYLDGSEHDPVGGSWHGRCGQRATTCTCCSSATFLQLGKASSSRSTGCRWVWQGTNKRMNTHTHCRQGHGQHGYRTPWEEINSGLFHLMRSEAADPP